MNDQNRLMMKKLKLSLSERKKKRETEKKIYDTVKSMPF